jgi:hypothetical protein
MSIHIGTTKDEKSAFDTTCHSRAGGNDSLGGRIPIFVAMTNPNPPLAC